MSSEQQQLEAGIAALEAQRGMLGDAVVDASIAGLRAKLAALKSPPPEQPTQTLRQVSILFVDVVGSTALSQYLDPEAISGVLDDALARATAVVESRRGKVLQYAGDNLLAAFGADGAAEDDAERAVYCGLALLELGKQLGAEVQARHGRAGFNVRAGIHTGGVLLGGGVDAEGTIRGIAVNIAARMEQTAPAGALRISGDTYAQVRGMFEVEAQLPLAVKGIDQPIQSYLVKSAKSRSFRIGTRGIEGVTTKMIGRDAELEQLQAAFRRLFQARRLEAVTVVGEAGIGKSRLLYEFEAWGETRPERFFLFRGRATPQTGTQAYGLLREIVAWRLQIADDDSVAAARKKMEDGIVPLFVHDGGLDLAEAHAHLLGHLIGIEWKDSRHLRGILDDPRQIRNRAFHAAAQLFHRITASGGGLNDEADRAIGTTPVVLRLEDLHWADSESLDFLNYLAEVSRDLPLLMLASTRPTLFERRADWGSSEGMRRRIDLQPLGKDMSRLLANELLKKLPEIPAALRELLTSSAEGNPFYMEELVRMLIDQGAINTQSETGETWSVDAERLLLTHVPPTLTGVLQARLDSLPAPEKRAIQQASIVGAVFWDQALAAIETQAAEQLPALVRRELTLPRGDAPLEGLREYAFRHQVLYQVTYDTVLKRYKRDGHARVARWLAQLTERGGLRAGDLLMGLAAEHFEQAEDAANAVEFHTRAAEHAGQRMAHERVLVHVERALAQLGQADPTMSTSPAELRWRLLSVREKTLELQARRDDQAADLDALEQVAEALDDDHRRAEVALRRTFRALRMADWAAMERTARHAQACGTRASDDDQRVNALRLVATAQIEQGDIDAGRALALQGLDEARRLGLRIAEARLINTLALAADRMGDALGALELERLNLEAVRETGNQVDHAVFLYNVGESLMKLGELAQAQQELDAALQLLRANGDRVGESVSMSTLSMLALWQGDEARALTLARQAGDIAAGARAREAEVFAGLRLGDAELAFGRLDAARKAFGEARTRAHEISSALEHDASAGLARVALVHGDGDTALAALRALLSEGAASGGILDSTEFPRRIALTCYQALARAGDPLADEWLVRAHTALMAQIDAIERSASTGTGGRSGEALQEGLLRNIPWHREIVEAWSKHAASAGTLNKPPA